MQSSRKHLLRWLWLFSVLFLGYLLGSKWGGSAASSPHAPGGFGGGASPNIPSGMYGSSAPRAMITPGPRSAEQNLPSSAALLARSGATPSRPPAAVSGEGTLSSRCEGSSAYTLSRIEGSGDPECREMLRNSLANEFTSQYNQDAWLFHNFFRCMEGPGTYADIGAGLHPRKLSNTWFLDRCLGWKGVCAEADHEAAMALRANRSCTVVESAVSTFPGRGSVESGPGGVILTKWKSLESLEKEAKEAGREGKIEVEEGSVPLLALEDVLVAADWEPSEETGRVRVDYLNVAVEDHEFEVLFGTPWDLVEIRFITVDNVKNSLDVRELLNDQGYVLVQSVGMDDFFARLPLDKELWRPSNLNWNRNAHAGIRKKYHQVNSYLKEALYKGWDELSKFVNKNLNMPQ